MIETIQKIKSCRYIDLESVTSEIERVAALMATPAQAMQSSYHVHKVPVGGINYLVADAKVVNKHTNQSGRGNMRYLFDMKTRTLAGLAQEVDNGSYRRVA